LWKPRLARTKSTDKASVNSATKSRQGIGARDQVCKQRIGEIRDRRCAG
jgi:hypothetical protein